MEFPRILAALVVFFQFVGANILFYPTKTVIDNDLEVRGVITQNAVSCCSLPVVTLSGLNATLDQYTWYQASINMPWNTSSAITVDASVGSMVLAQPSSLYNFLHEISKPLWFYASASGALTIRVQDFPYMWTSSYTVTAKTAVTSTFYKFEVRAIRALNAGAWQTQMADIQFFNGAGTNVAAPTIAGSPATGTPNNIKDNNPATKWQVAQTLALCPNPTTCTVATNYPSLTFSYSGATQICKYSWFTGDDVPARDPVAWIVYKGTSVSGPWTAIHTQAATDITLARKTIAGTWTLPCN